MEKELLDVQRFAEHLPEPFHTAMKEHMGDECNWSLRSDGGMYCDDHDIKVAPAYADSTPAIRTAIFDAMTDQMDAFTRLFLKVMLLDEEEEVSHEPSRSQRSADA